jgi:3-deoxy-D-manno-octulosonic-acid transferase
MKERGMASPFLRSSVDQGESRNGRKVVIVDRTGELFKVFSLATVVFMGGSLVPRGGQNILEPASWGKMVFFGPSMGDFREARDILERVGAGIEIKGKEDLVAGLTEALSNLEKTSDLGIRGREEVMKHVGSADRNARILVELLTIKETR